MITSPTKYKGATRQQLVAMIENMRVEIKDFKKARKRLDAWIDELHADIRRLEGRS